MMERTRYPHDRKEYYSWGWVDKEAGKLSHYGMVLELDKPCTGVIAVNSLDHDHIDPLEGEDLGWEEYLEEHMFDCETAAENDGECMCEHDYYETNGPWLVGDWKKGEDGQWEPDMSATQEQVEKYEREGYAAIYREDVVQVVWSLWTKKCQPCSPCYPGQGDLDNVVEAGEAGMVCYALPEEAIYNADL